MIIRRTASQIKLVVVINNQYRVYNLLTEKVTWFRYKHQMTRHYGDNNILIDVSNATILNGEFAGKQIAIGIGYGKYKTFGGNIIDEETADTQNLVILKNIRIARGEESTLHEQIATRLTLVRYLHGNLRFITDARFTTGTAANTVLTYHFNPANCISYRDVYNAQSTRPYNMHITVSDVSSILNGWEEDRYHTDIPLNGNSATFASGDGVMRISGNSNTTTYTAPPQEEIRTDLIRRYHSGGTIRPKNGTNDDSRRYFGIELEIDNPGSYNERLRNKMATRLHNLLNENGEYNSLVKFENDGSLGANGIEMIFQPMSYKYIIENREKLFRALKTVDTTGYSSHDAGTCGYHIHVSRTEIPNDVLDRVLMIFENFKNEFIAFSRRNEEQMRWCKFMCTTNIGNLTKDSIRYNRERGSINGHGYVINNQNRNTVEFRLFRGTTNKRTFMAALQLVDNIVSIAQKRETIEGLRWLDVINYNDEYAELKEYNKKRNIYSTHVATEIIDVESTNLRGVILVRPHQLRLEGDR